MVRIRTGVLCALLVLATAALGACSSDSGESVDVTLNDFTMKPDVSSTAAGDIKFKVKNGGGFVHEMVVVKTADYTDLETEKNGQVNEDKIPKAEQMGEVEDIKPGKTGTLKLTLTAGKYVLFCNRIDGTSAHFQKGMHADFTVTG